MKLKDLDPLCRLADALYQREARTLATLSAREQKIRAAIAAVNAAGEGLQTGDLEQSGLYARSGADTAWLTWAGQRKTTYNAELAQVLVQKAHELENVRQAFGRQEALRLLQERAKKNR